MKSFTIRYAPPALSLWGEPLAAKLKESEYRHAYMVEGVKTWIARQVRVLREQRGWSQEKLGEETGKPQTAISRVEDPDYGKLTLRTLFDLAKAYDLGLLVQFVEWPDWLNRMEDLSTENLQRESFGHERSAALSALAPQYSVGGYSPYFSAVFFEWPELHNEWHPEDDRGIHPSNPELETEAVVTVYPAPQIPHPERNVHLKFDWNLASALHG